MLPRGTALVAVVATGLSGAALAQFDNQWVTYSNGTAAHLAMQPLAVSDMATEVDFAAADFDKDGDIDLAVVRKQPAVTAGKRTNILLMNEGGVLTDRTAQYAAASDVAGDQGFLTPTNDRDVVASDLDGDGWLDLVTCVALGWNDPKHLGHPRVYMNLGTDTQGAWQGFRYEDARIPAIPLGADPVVGPNACAVAAGDVTGDGAPDLFFADYDDGEPGNVDTGHVLLVNDGFGFFTNETQLRLTPNMISSGFGTAAQIVDLNQDGVNDIIRSMNGPVDVYYNNPANVGVFNLLGNAYSSAAYFMNTGDLNNDGRLDFAVGDDVSDAVRYNKGNDALGRVIWSASKTYKFLAGGDDGFANQMELVDLDGDGWRDVVQTDFDVQGGGCNRRTHIYHNPGGAIGAEIQLVEERQNASASSWLGVVGMFQNDLNGTYNVAVFDIENDGDLDMVLGRCSGTFVWLNQNVQGVCQTDVGFGGPGDAKLTACGSGLGSGQTVTLRLSQARPLTLATLLVSASSNPVFVNEIGGTLAAFPILLVVPVPTDATGKFALPVPGGNGPAAVWVQAITPDGTSGYEVSNALRLDFQP